MTQIVTELVIDARGAEAGAQAYVNSINLAEDAAGRLIDQNAAIGRAAVAQSTTVVRTGNNSVAAFERLRNSVDPVARAQANLEKATATLDGAVNRGITTQEEAARVLGLVRAKYDAVSAETSEYSQNVTRAGNVTDKAGQAVNRMIGFLATLGIALGVRELVQYADAWTNAGNRITAVSGGTAEETEATRSALADLAAETRSDFDSTVALYARLAGAAESLGATQSDLFSVVRTVNESIALTGGSSSAAAGAINQLAQALGSGQLRGDEFNSIMENAPMLAEAIADEMGVASVELRGLAEEGAITSKVVFDALLNSADTIGASFQATKTTVSQALTSLSTRFTEFIGGADGATGASEKLVGVLDWVAEHIDVVVTAVGALAGALVAVKIVGLIADIGKLGAAFSVLRTAAAFLLTNPFGLAITAIGLIVGGIIYMNSRTEEASVSMEEHEAIVDRVREAYNEAGGAVDDWASRIEDVTAAQAMLDVRARADDLAAAQEALLTGHYAGNTEESRQLAGAITNLKQAFVDGEIALADFNAAMDSYVETDKLTPDFVVHQQALAAAFDAARKSSKEATAVYNVLTGNATDADKAILGLTTRMDAGAEAAAGLADAAARAAAEIAQLNGGGGALTAGTTPATQFHDGGVVGAGGRPRNVPSALFVGAPRFHAGLASDEFPAILQRGETVIPRGGSAVAMASTTTGSVDRLAESLKEAKSAAMQFGVSFVQALINAKSPLEALQGSLSSLSSTMLSSAGQSFMSGNFAGGIIRGIIGIVAGIIARRIQERRELAAARQAWADMSDELADFAARLNGTGGGALAASIADVTAQLQPYFAAAEKAKASTAGLTAMIEDFAETAATAFLDRFPLMIDALDSGLGSSSPAVKAAESIAAIGVELRGFVADAATATEILGGTGAAVRAAQEAAQGYALTLLGAPRELSAVETELLRISGTAAALTGVLADLGMSADEAAAAIADGVNAALDELRGKFAADLGAKLNDALGRGYLNDVSDLVDEATQLLDDAARLGLSGADVGRYFAAQAQAIVDGAGLTGDAFAELLDLFPQLAGVVHESSASIEAAMDRINDAAAGVLDYVRGLLTGSESTLSPEARLANARAAYDAQLGLAQSGDLGAQSKITDFADALLEAARTMFASSAGYQDVFARVTTDLLGLPAVAATTDPGNASLRQSLGGMPSFSPSAPTTLGLGVSTAYGGAPVPANDAGAVDAGRQNFVDLMRVTQAGDNATILSFTQNTDRVVERLEAIERAIRTQVERPRRAGQRG